MSLDFIKGTVFVISCDPQYLKSPEAEFKEFKSRLKSAKTRFKLSAGLNLETFDKILSETTIIKPRLKLKPRLKFFKFGLCLINTPMWMLKYLLNIYCLNSRNSSRFYRKTNFLKLMDISFIIDNTNLMHYCY